MANRPPRALPFLLMLLSVTALADSFENAQTRTGASVLFGRVADDAGEPSVGQRVSILQRQYVSGRRRFTTSASSTTDDRGEFRITPLPPGEYVACAVVSDRTLPEAIFSAPD